MALPDRIIGKYTIRGKLGEGAMGVVYEGFDQDIERRVAIKTLHPARIMDMGSDFLVRFKREAQAIAKCHHPNIVTILEYGMHGQLPYMVMEFVDGKSLAEYLRDNGRLSLKTVLTLVIKVLKALQVAHSHDIVHRDIKPANIMLTKKCEVRLTDFGIARHETKEKLTQTGFQLGTPAYMSPEQLVGGKVDNRSDLYSLSIVFFELLTHLPNDSLNALGHIDTYKGVSINSKFNTEIPMPQLLVPLIEKGLQINPDNRFQSVEQMSGEILRVYKLLNLTGRSGLIESYSELLPSKEATTNIAPHAQATLCLPTTMTTLTKYGTGDSLIDAVSIDTMRDELEKLLGDKASEIIRNEVAFNLSRAEAIYAIAQHIKKPRQQTQFIDRWSI